MAKMAEMANRHSPRKTRRVPNWMPYVKNSLYDYPEIHAELDALRSMSMTASYSGMPGGGGPGDPVFQVVTRKGSVSEDEVRMHDAIEKAMQQTRAKKNWKSRMKLVEMVYFKQTHTIAGAADQVHYSYVHAKDMLDEFLHQVAKNRGLE